jgi:hypothetical protein
MIACQQCGRTGADVLGIRVNQARPDSFERWQPLHGECFDAAGFSYGISASDILARGSAFWAGHIGEKTWAGFTDYRSAIPEFQRRAAS